MEGRSINQSRTGGRVSPGLLIIAGVLISLLITMSTWFGPQIRMWGAFFLLLLLPGVAPVLLALGRSLDPPEKLAASFVGSLVILVAAALLSHIFGWGLSFVLWAIPAATVILGLVLWVFPRGLASAEDKRADVNGPGRSTDTFPTKAIRYVTWALLASAVLWSATLSGEIGPTTDAFDHIATVREINDTGELFPLSAFYNAPEAPLPDPRKGVFHIGLAALCRYSGQDPVDVWMWLPGVLLPLSLLVVFCLGRTLTGSWAGGWVAALFWLLCFGGPTSRLPIQVGYAHNVSEVASWVLTMLLVKYAAGGKRELVLASAVGLVACCFVHISAFVLLMASWGCFLAAAVVLGGSRRRRLTVRLARAGLVWLVFGLLAAAAKVLMSYAPANPVQLQSQNLLYWGSSLYIVNPLWVFRWFGFPGALAAVLAIGLAFRSREVPGRLYMAGACLIPILVVLNPLAVPLFYPIIGYLVERFAWVAPYPHMLAFAAVAAYRRVLLPGGVIPRLGAASLLIAVVVSVALTGGGRSSVPKVESGRLVPWRPALDYLQAAVDTSAVVASDLLTSYSIPAFTRHHAVSTLHQHGSPNDPRGIDRIVALVELMNPDAPGKLLKDRLVEQEVDFVLVNRSFDRKLLLHYAEADPASLERLRVRLKGQSGVFREVYAHEDASIFAVDRNALLEWTPRDVGPPPYVLPRGVIPPGRRVNAIFDDKIELLSVELPQRPVRDGDAFNVICYWQSKVEKLRFDIPWVVQIRVQRDYAKGRFYSPAYSKVYRKVLELMKKENYRMRAAHLPARGVIPPSLWGDCIIKDVAEVPVPRWLAPGTYELSVFIGRRAIYPNLTWRDLLRDDDCYSGVTVGTIVIE